LVRSKGVASQTACGVRPMPHHSAHNSAAVSLIFLVSGMRSAGTPASASRLRHTGLLVRPRSSLTAKPALHTVVAWDRGGRSFTTPFTVDPPPDQSSFTVDAPLRAGLRRLLFEFPFDVEKLPVSLDLQNNRLAACQLMNPAAQILHAEDGDTIQ